MTKIGGSSRVYRMLIHAGHQSRGGREQLGVPRDEQAQFPAIVRDIFVVFENRPSPEQLATAARAQQ